MPDLTKEEIQKRCTLYPALVALLTDVVEHSNDPNLAGRALKALELDKAGIPA